MEPNKVVWPSLWNKKLREDSVRPSIWDSLDDTAGAIKRLIAKGRILGKKAKKYVLEHPDKFTLEEIFYATRGK